MVNLKKVVSLLSAVSILSSLVVSTAFAATFSDVPASAYYYEAVEALVDSGVIDGTKGTYNPAGNLQRDEAAKFVVTAAGLAGDLPATATFTDVPKTGWSFEYVEKAYSNGVVSGYKTATGTPTGKFGPSDKVTREQYAKMIVEAFDLPTFTPASPTFPDVPASAWSYGYVETAYNWSVINGYANGKFGPGDNIVRQDGAVMTFRAETPVERTDTGDDDTTFTGDLEVSLNSASPDGATVPSQATAVPAAIFDFEAAGGDTELDALTVHMYGVSATTSISNVYLYNGNERLTSGKTINSTTKEAVFNNLSLAIDKGDTLSLTLKMDVANLTAASEAGFELESAAAVDAGTADVGGTFPVKGDKFDLSTTDAGTLTITKNGSITDPKVGEDDVTLAKFKMAADGEAGNVEQIGLYFAGTIATDAIENLELYVSGEADPIATVDGLNAKDIALFELDDAYLIDKGATKAFTVKGDLNTGRNADTVLVYIDEKTDVVVIGDTYGFGMNVDITTSGTYDGTSCTTPTFTDCSGSTLLGGDITISSNGPSATDVSVNGKDVALMDFSITSVSDVTFKNFEIALTASESADTDEGLLNDADSDNPNFTDIKVLNKETGSTLMGPVDANSSFYTATNGGGTVVGVAEDIAGDSDEDIAYHKYTDEFTMDAGEELSLSLTTDIKNDTDLNDMTILGTLSITTALPEVRDTNNKVITNTSSIVPSSAIAGKTMTVKSPDLTVSLASSPVSKTYVKGTHDVKYTGMVFACGNSTDCNITDVTLQGYVDDDGAANTWSITGLASDNSTYMNAYVGSVKLVDADGVAITGYKSVESDADVVFTNVGWTLDAGETAIAYVVGNVSSDAYKNSNGENLAFGIAALADVTYEDEEGTTRNPSAAILNTGTGATDPSTFVTVSGGGSLTLAVDADTAREDILVSGVTDQNVAKFKFTTTDEGFTIGKLAINAKQLGVLTADLGEYDNNVTSIKISYPNSAGTTETKSGFLTSGTASFTGMDFFIGENDSEVLTVTATLNSIASGQATAGEFVDMNVAFSNFEALAAGSGETYKADKIDATVDAASDLDFGTITWTDSTDQMDADDLVGATVAGTSSTFTVNNGVNDTIDQNYPVGTLLCIDDDGSAGCTTGEDIYVVTATSGTGPLTVTATLLDDAGDGTYDALSDPIDYSLPGTGYLTATNRMYVYESKPTVSLSSSSPSGSRSVNASDNVFLFDVKADAKEDIQIRAGLAGDDEADPVETTMADGEALVTTAAGEVVDGAGAIEWTGASIADEDCYLFDEVYTAGTLDDYAYASFWLQSSETDVTYNSMSLIFDDNTACAAGGDDQYDLGSTASSGKTFVNGAALTAGTGAIAAGVADSWALITVKIPTNLTLAASTSIGFGLETTAPTVAFVDTDEFVIDGFVMHNEALVLDLTSDLDFDGNNTSGLTAYLKEGGNIVAQGGVGYDLGTEASGAAHVLFVPGGLNPADTYPAITVAKGTTKTFTFNVDTATMLVEDGGSDDPLGVSFDLGSSADGTVTEGDFWWYETNATVQWLGNVPSSTIVGNTLRY
ncbi:MAG: S-layer homology domain-containing protein [Candidatus Gracilibacteria bacterium]